MAIDYPNFSVKVIDNSSSDASLDMIKKNYPHVGILALDKNYGYSRAYNRCFDYLKDKETEYILLLNNDTEVEPNILRSFIKAIEQCGINHIFGGKIFYHRNPNRIWFAGGKVNLKLGWISHRGIRKMDSEKYSIPMKTDYVTGCCMFTSMKVIDKLHGFDEQFKMYGEDVDLCLRAKKAGILCYYWPEAQLRHHVSYSLGGNMKIGKIIKKFQSLIKLYLKHNFIIK